MYLLIFYQFNASLPNKNINFFPKKRKENSYWAQTLNGSVHNVKFLNIYIFLNTIFCNIVNVFTVSFDHVSLLNKILIFFQKN